MALGQFLYLRVREAWTSYWLLRDAQKGIALVTKEWWSGHSAVGYKYVVDGREYTSHGGRNWEKRLLRPRTGAYVSRCASCWIRT